MRLILGAAIGSLFVLLSVVVGAPVDAHERPSAVRARVQVVDAPHTPPVDGPIIDPFRLPEFEWQAGNRGLEYDTTPGQIVHASSSGVVTFSGQVGGSLFVTIRHDSELRTTVGFVVLSLVETGDVVRQGDPIAIAGDTMHFTARNRGQYIDPELLFQRFRTVVRLTDEPG